MQFSPNSPMGRLLKKPDKVKARALRMWRWKHRILVAQLEKELM